MMKRVQEEVMMNSDNVTIQHDMILIHFYIRNSIFQFPFSYNLTILIHFKSFLNDILIKNS